MRIDVELMNWAIRESSVVEAEASCEIVTDKGGKHQVYREKSNFGTIFHKICTSVSCKENRKLFKELYSLGFRLALQNIPNK